MDGDPSFARWDGKYSDGRPNAAPMDIYVYAMNLAMTGICVYHEKYFIPKDLVLPVKMVDTPFALEEAERGDEKTFGIGIARREAQLPQLALPNDPAGYLEDYCGENWATPVNMSGLPFAEKEKINEGSEEMAKARTRHFENEGCCTKWPTACLRRDALKKALAMGKKR